MSIHKTQTSVNQVTLTVIRFPNKVYEIFRFKQINVKLKSTTFVETSFTVFEAQDQ